ncbi:MAG: hypothetical protein M1820_006390 [Bogoriella megaspora]|nr:MAG: hypothetical protein M1820_006390 [Bogoriella megaspora]
MPASDNKASKARNSPLTSPTSEQPEPILPSAAKPPFWKSWFQPGPEEPHAVPLRQQREEAQKSGRAKSKIGGTWLWWLSLN